LKLQPVKLGTAHTSTVSRKWHFHTRAAYGSICPTKIAQIYST